nr:PREDICTED: probable Histone-lysine N-methyltransferase ATXR5 [Daucus carota subsp. sativus]
MSVLNTPTPSPPNHFSRVQGKRKERGITDIYKRAKRVVVPRDDYSDVRCKLCRSGDKEEEILLCDGCDDGFHVMCLRPVVLRVPEGSWFCDACSDQHSTTPKKYTHSQVRNKFFGITDSSMKYISPEVARRPRKRNCWQKTQNKWTKLLPYIPSNNPERRKMQMETLHSALKGKKLEFSNELTYPQSMAPRHANQSKFETDNMQVLSKENLRTVAKCKEMHKRGKCPPLKVVYDAHEGFVVQADGPIKPMTFITEYVGDVDYVKNREEDECDSLMTLLVNKDASRSLLICPDKRANIARFISGINNRSKEGNKKKNLKSVRYSVHGECRVFLVAIRHIAEGERLYYNYNGQENAYPTDHFI